MKITNNFQYYLDFCRNYEAHCNDAEWTSTNYYCDKNIFDVSTTLTEALWINELLCTAYLVSGFGESILIAYLKGNIGKDEMIRELILAGDKVVKALRDKRRANKAPRQRKK